MVFQYLESTLHTLVVAKSDKHRTSFQFVRNNLCKMVCIKLVNLSESENLNLKNYCVPDYCSEWVEDKQIK